MQLDGRPHVMSSLVVTFLLLTGVQQRVVTAILLTFIRSVVHLVYKKHTIRNYTNTSLTNKLCSEDRKVAYVKKYAQNLTFCHLPFLILYIRQR